MGKGGARTCENCKYWRPHRFYEGIGVCTLKWPWRMTFADDSCENWEPLIISKPGFYWCHTCKQRVGPEEYEEHLRKGHRLYPSVYLEPEVKEELYSVE